MTEGKMKLSLCFFVWVFLLGFHVSIVRAHGTLSTSVAIENKNGLGAIILNAIAKELKVTLITQYAPFSRRLHMMKDGTIDLMAGLLKRPEREKYIHFISPPYKNRSDTVFFVPKGKSSLIQTYNDLHPLRIGTTFGSKYFHRFDEDETLDKESIPNGMSNFKKLLLGRLDTVIYPEGAGIELIHKMDISDRVEMAQFRFSKKKQVYIGISKKSHLMEDIHATESIIRQMIENGKIKNIIVNYYTQRNLPVPAH